jgi:hypothetical protein
MISDTEIRDRMAAVAASEESLDSFEAWFVQQSWNVHKYGNVGAQRLVYWIELRLAEYSSGHLTEEHLLGEFRNLLSTASINLGADSPATIVESGSSLSVTVSPIAQMQPAGTEPSRAFE